ncbi:MAG: AAA family ATPase, partial [Microthrixaceae bacterium]|nr:AAA family ATPase [Microthrixaceae bacterium]
MTSTTSRLAGDMTVLDPFVSAGLFNESEVELCAAISRLAESGGNQVDPLVLLGIAVAARGPRSGHVCIDLSRVSELIVDENTLGVELPWPDQDTWISALRASENLVCGPDQADHNPVRPLVLDGTRLYLHRYFVAEARVAADMLRRSSTKASLSFDSGDLDSTLDTFFGAEADGQTDLQRQGARSGLTNSFSVLAGGPGTGKTRTVARMLATAHTLARADGRHLLIGLAAPSGKAAARMAEAIEQAVEQLVEDNLIDDAMATQLRNAEPVTIHRLLRSNPRRGFGHNQSNPLALDIIVIDESSMVSLPLMDSLLAAVPDRCHLVLVGDPDQLASVQAGTVLGDIVRPAIATDGRAPAGASGSHPTPVADPSLSANQITVLKVARRFGSDSSIAALADAVRLGDADKTLQIL